MFPLLTDDHLSYILGWAHGKVPTLFVPNIAQGTGCLEFGPLPFEGIWDAFGCLVIDKEQGVNSETNSESSSLE